MLLIEMLFLHVLEDFHLQGILAQFKQKKWWKDNYPQKLYEYDWLISLIAHSFEWCCFIYLPIFIKFGFKLTLPIAITFVVNLTLHCIIDHLKCNLLKIGLITDQILHFIQIYVTCGLFNYVFK